MSLILGVKFYDSWSSLERLFVLSCQLGVRIMGLRIEFP